ncbi:MAG: molybdopterin biosynthesis protein [Syntrophomonadaceae bacterium]|nr:molybdopterin biosynthesis protein [Syntrophomonadaceae bacterium]
MDRNIYIDNVPLDKALDLFMERLDRCDYFEPETEVVDVLNSQGRVTGAPVFAQKSSPHYAASAMDGIAVKASLTYGASETNPVSLLKGRDFIEVDTGDYIPREFNAVIMIEDVNFIDDYAQIIKPAVPWQHIRSVGEDLVAQEMIVPSYYKIGPHEIASFLTAAVETVEVLKKPIVAIIPTGTELVDRGHENMAPGEIVDSNSRMLEGLCRDWGALPVRYEIVADDRAALRETIEKAKGDADMVIICSGSSAGREDYTASAIREFGEVLVHGLATRPGKPAILGIIDDKPVIGVPGYPVSAHLIFDLFVRPVLLKKQRLDLPEPEKLECKIPRKIASPMGVDEYIYVNVAKIKNSYIAYPLNRGAGISTSLVKADGVTCIQKDNEGLQAGDTCIVSLKRSRSIIDQTLVAIGSHDMSIDFLCDILNRNYGIRLISANAGSMGGIMSLVRKETHFSGIHLLDYDTGDYNLSYLKKYLADEKWILVNLVKREQGLILKKGNPLNITGIKDLTRKDIRFINRQKGAGTRLLLDYLLTKNHITPAEINGYNREEYTHLSVAAAVKNDACDVGLGIYASAKVMELDFIPVSEERYDLCILVDVMSERNINILFSCINSQEFKNKLTASGGYNLEMCGEIIFKNQL